MRDRIYGTRRQRFWMDKILQRENQKSVCPTHPGKERKLIEKTASVLEEKTSDGVLHTCLCFLILPHENTMLTDC